MGSYIICLNDCMKYFITLLFRFSVKKTGKATQNIKHTLHIKSQ